MEKDCVFCKIVKGEVPSYTVYEDEIVKAFLTIEPINEGHILIIPKKHHVDINDAPDDVIQHISLVTKRLAKQLGKKLGTKDFSVINNNGKDAQQTVFHYHVQLIPRHKDDGFDIWYKTNGLTESNFEETLKKLKD